MTDMTETDRTQAAFVARTIRQQLTYDGPFGAMACIAARDWQAIGPDDTSQGGLRFRVSIRKPKTRHWIVVTLQWTDTYRVRLLRLKRGASTLDVLLDTDESDIQVYCDELKDTVETFAEAHA